MEEILKMRKEIEELLARVDSLCTKIKKLEAVYNDGIKDGDEYFHSDGAGFIYSSIAGENKIIDDNCKRIGNRFKTREECEFAVKRLEVLAKIKKFEEPDDCPWDRATQHFYLAYITDARTITIGNLYANKCNDIYFETRAMAEKCIEAVGEEDLIKYYFKIKE